MNVLASLVRVSAEWILVLRDCEKGFSHELLDERAYVVQPVACTPGSDVKCDGMCVQKVVAGLVT